MNDRADTNFPEFWNQRYQTGDTPWALRRIPSALESFLRRRTRGETVLIPGCGNDYEVIGAFHSAGFAVTAIDLSPVAVAQAKAALGSLATSVINADFFEHDFGPTRFDLVYERTFLCALPPSRWLEYIERLADLLVPGGLLAGYYFYGQEADPPPYPLTVQSAQDVLGKRFRLNRTETVTDSLPIFAHSEKWQEWEVR